MKKNQRMGLNPTYIELNFETDLDHVSIPPPKKKKKNRKKSRFPHLLFITCHGRGVPSPSARVRNYFFVP